MEEFYEAFPNRSIFFNDNYLFTVSGDVRIVTAGTWIREVTTTGAVSAGGFYLIEAGRESDNSLIGFVNGVDMTYGRVDDGETMSVGNMFSNMFDGYIGELIIYDRIVDGDEISNLRTYLNNKWSIF